MIKQFARSAVFLMLTSMADACVIGPRVSLFEILSRSSGAVIVEPTNLGHVGEWNLVLMNPIDRLHDPNALGRSTVVAAVEMPYQPGSTQGNRGLGFWSGKETAFRYSGANCALTLSIDYSRRYLVLLGVTGPFSIEPLADANDEWLEFVKEYFATRKIAYRSRTVRQLTEGLESIEIGTCSTENPEMVDAVVFHRCVLDENKGRPKERPLVVNLHYDFGTRTLPSALPDLKIKSEDLSKQMGVALDPPGDWLLGSLVSELLARRPTKSID